MNELEGVSAAARGAGPVSALRRFARARPAQERCELCSAPLAAQHAHLLELARRQLVCACEPCAFLFSSPTAERYRRVSRRAERLSDFRLSDAQWQSLYIPIGLAFFICRVDGVTALYPSPAGATECTLDLAAWDELVRENPVLQELAPEVEALLVNRVGATREYFRVSIDECFRLVGLLRKHWKGLSGGAEVWEAMHDYFAGLNVRAQETSGA